MVGVVYTKKEYPEIFMNELESALLQSLISRQEDFERYIRNREDISNFYVMILSVVAEAIGNLYEDLDNEYYSNKVDYAVDIDLDDLGKLINCRRPQGTRSAVKLTFTLTTAQDHEVRIPQGILTHSSNGLSFKTSEELYFAVGETEKTITALCTERGSRHQTPAFTVTFHCLIYFLIATSTSPASASSTLMLIFPLGLLFNTPMLFPPTKTEYSVSSSIPMVN